MKKIYSIIAVILALGIIGSFEGPDDGTEQSSNQVSVETTEASKDKAQEETETNKAKKKKISAVTYSLDNVPAFSGTPYYEINNNVPFFTEREKTNTNAFESYGKLDELGRCQTAYANVCKEVMPTEERGEIGYVKPSGWQTIKYDIVQGKYLYNRCHLIGFQLAGENANVKNLITGTRYFNVEGMLPFENEVADYVTSTSNHVLYRVTPRYEGNNLVASGVIMEGYSVEDEGSGVSFCVYVYNVQPGITIDYLTGESWEDGTIEPTQEETTTRQTVSQESHTLADYIINTNTGKFHYPYCSSVDRMSEQNKAEFSGDREELIDMGYDPCGLCHP